MKTLPVLFAPEAEQQLKDIENYIATQGAPEAGFRVKAAIYARCLKIGDLPFGGSPRDEITSGLRTISFRQQATIAYTVEEQSVVIQAVLYRGRDIGRFFT